MMYLAYLRATNGAFHRFEFENDNNELAKEHVIQVACDPEMHFLWDEEPFGEIEVKFRRHYAEEWHVAGTFTPWRKLKT
jgi:hypothetical protein